MKDRIIEALRKENSQLLAELERLRASHNAIDAQLRVERNATGRVRHELGIIVQFLNGNGSSNQVPTCRRDSKPAPDSTKDNVFTHNDPCSNGQTCLSAGDPPEAQKTKKIPGDKFTCWKCSQAYKRENPKIKSTKK